MSLLGDLGTAVKNKLGGTSVDNTVPRYNGTTCTLQGSGVTISDTNAVTASGGFVGNLTGNASTATTATNASKLNDAVEATTATANTIVKRDANGYVYVEALNSTLADTTTAATHYYCETGSDGYIRPKPLANVKAEIGVSLALTGTPTAPTAAAGTYTTQIATTAFVQYAITNNGFGVGQVWTDVKASRALGATYTNSSGKPIEVFVTVNNTSPDGNYYISIIIGGVLIGSQAASAAYASPGNQFASAQFTVPNGTTYSVASSAGYLAYWQELR